MTKIQHMYVYVKMPSVRYLYRISVRVNMARTNEYNLHSIIIIVYVVEILIPKIACSEKSHPYNVEPLRKIYCYSSNFVLS